MLHEVAMGLLFGLGTAMCWHAGYFHSKGHKIASWTFYIVGVVLIIIWSDVK